MKLKNIIISGFALLSMTACNDYLEVEAPSSYTTEFVFSMKSEMERALNGVYAQALSSNIYGNNYFTSWTFNSDVDMQTNANSAHQTSSFQRFDGDETSGGVYSAWTSFYNLIEYCNKFIYAASNSDFMKGETKDPEVLQWIGEAKCLRAMAYHDLVVYFGDVPFKFEPSSVTGADYVPPVVDRQVIQDSLIADLDSIAPHMANTQSVTVERCSKEFAQAMIARIALTAGGYSLRPNKDDPKSYGKMERPKDYKKYYQKAMEATKAVIDAGIHNVNTPFQNVFIKECNYQLANGDDPIFEIPFTKESSGSIGYIQGPKYSSYEGKTVGPWGACNSGANLNAFYRFLFREGDYRREFVNGLWNYSYYTDASGALADSCYINIGYTAYNNKWSKLWTSEGSTLGDISTGSTGINYPYMRYADVLLMYAEADNEINGKPSDLAMECLRQVHKRNFADGDEQFITDNHASKEAFLKAVLDERKWEFAGENSRWRDLVRNNLYAQEVVYSFLRYHSVGMQSAGSPSGFEDAINIHDGFDVEAGEDGYIESLPTTVYYHLYNIDDLAQAGARLYYKQMYGYVFDTDRNVVFKYPLQARKSMRIANAYKSGTQPANSTISRAFPGDKYKGITWMKTTVYNWGDEATGLPKNECKYSFYGYIRSDANGNILLIKDGAPTMFPTTVPSADQLPPVRYILPYPQKAIQDSEGKYKNYYGYSN
ncbi:MAG: RagB/SusD family nutrient uptake outer membrane protein [Prevotella sp.]|nr:RagB/SusD family nutrient uptake outer membrane protein [Prevotella sp.]